MKIILSELDILILFKQEHYIKKKKLLPYNVIYSFFFLFNLLSPGAVLRFRRLVTIDFFPLRNKQYSDLHIEKNAKAKIPIHYKQV